LRHPSCFISQLHIATRSATLAAVHVLVFVIGDRVEDQLEAFMERRIDAYETGGRWAGVLPRRGPDGTVEPVDSLCAGEIAWDQAYAEVEAAAREVFGEWRALCERHGWPRSRAEIAAELGHEPDRFGRYPREVYERCADQPAARAYAEAHPDDQRCPVTVFGLDEEAYVRGRIAGRISPFAIIAGGQWIESPIGLDRHVYSWSDAVRDRLRGLPPDTLVTAVDCHY